MQTFDVYLKKRLTEIDVYITQLVQRDTFSIYNVLNLFALMGDIETHKIISADSIFEMEQTIDDLLEKVHEVIKSDFVLKASADLYDSVFTMFETEIVLDSDELDSLLKRFTEINSTLEISVANLDYYIAHSFGKFSVDIEMYASQLSTQKNSYENFIVSLLFDVESEFSSEKEVEVEEILMELHTSQTDIFYLLTTGGTSSTVINISTLDKYILKYVLHDVDADSYLNITEAKIFPLAKYCEMVSAFYQDVNLADVLIRLINIANSISILSCEASAGLKRYRMFSDMDDFALSEFDSMTLKELDFVTII